MLNKNIRNTFIDLEDADLARAEKIAKDIIEHLELAFEYAGMDPRMKVKNSNNFNDKILTPSVFGFHKFFYGEIEDWGVEADIRNPIWCVALKIIHDECRKKEPVIREIVFEFFEWNFHLRHNTLKDFFRECGIYAGSKSTEPPPKLTFEPGDPELIALRCFQPVD